MYGETTFVGNADSKWIRVSCPSTNPAANIRDLYTHHVAAVYQGVYHVILTGRDESLSLRHKPG